MTAGRRVLRLVPSLAVGAAMAVSAEIAAVLLLYSGRGFLRALALILGVEAGAAALGAWTSQDLTGAGVVEGVRRRWLFALVTFTAAAVTAGAWAVVGGFADTRLGQGVGLALLGGLPMFAAGSLAGAMAQPGAGLDPGPGSRLPGPGSALVGGIAVGFLAAGLVLLPTFSPASVLLGSLVMLSGAALIHAAFLDPGVTAESLEELDTPLGPVRVEERIDHRHGAVARFLIVNGRVRAAESANGDPLLSDEAEIVRLARNQDAPSELILSLGGGAGTLARQLAQLTPRGRAELVEERPELVELCREHLSSTGQARVTVRVAHPLDSLGPGEPYPLVLLDGAALAGGAPAPRLDADALIRLRDRVAPGGVAIIHGLPALSDGTVLPVSNLVASVRGAFDRVTLVEAGAGEGLPGTRDRAFVVAELEPLVATSPWTPEP